MSSHTPHAVPNTVEAMPWIAAIVTGPEQQIQVANPRFRRVFGESAVPDSAGHETNDVSLRERIAHVQATRRPAHIRRCVVRALQGQGSQENGRRRSRRYLDLWLCPIDGDEPPGVLVYGIDITHRVRHARRLQGALAHQHRLLASLATSYWSADPSGLVLHAIEASRFTRSLARPRTGSALAGGTQGAAGLVGPGDIAEWQAAIRAGAPFVHTRSVVTDDGPRSYVVHAVPVFDDAGEVAEWLGVDIDITDFLQERPRDDQPPGTPQVLEARVRTMRGFSHDVRNVLHAADGYAQLLGSKVYGPLTAQQEEGVRRMRKLFGNALDLLSDMLSAERTLTGDLDAECMPTDIDALVADCADSHRAEAQLKNLIFEVDRSPRPRCTRTDPARVRQILDNLVSNALKYTTSGTVRIAVRSDDVRRAGDRRRWITISVTDTGPGVPSASRDAIFREFVRVADSTVPGHGVGLAISRRMARLLGGEITLETEPGAGSTFTLWLPLLWGEAAADSATVQTS